VTEDPELRWVREVYQGDTPQLTLRAAITGMALGGVLCLSNLYVVLKTGWSLGVTLTSCILAFAVFRVLGAVGVVRRDFSALENNAMGSVASAAAFMTGGGNMAALPALLVLTGARPGGFAMFLWFAVIAALGVLAAIPIKRRIINVEQLPFPSAVATAETIRSMHAGPGHSQGARLLVGAGLVAALVTFLRDARLRWLPFHLPGQLHFPFSIGGYAAAKWSLALDGSAVLLGGGALMGFRTAWSMLLGAVFAYGVLAPALVARGVIAVVEYKAIVQLTLWPGAAMLLSSGVVAFLLQGDAIKRSLVALVDVARRRGTDSADPVAAVEAPLWWFPAGFAVLSPVAVILMARLFGIPWWIGVLAIPLGLVMAVVAARVTGETDITPTKALGPATQLLYGLALPGNLTANVMGANVTGGMGLHAADLLTDLKSGYVLGASPRKQVAAQMLGVLVGAAVVVPAFNLLVPSADVLGTERFPAPAVMVWAGVSRVLASGLSGLVPASRVAVVVGLAVGAALALAERFAPRRWQRFVPSAAGLGIAMVMPGSSSLTMFAGALGAEILRRRRPEFAGRTLVPLAAGAIAGESILGVTMALVKAAG
jgi:OPT family oligopeptide transporter